MTAYDQSDWHKEPNKDSSQTTVRLNGLEFDTVHAWVQKHGTEEIFEAVSLTFGFTQKLTIIGNLSQELSHPESGELLEAWASNSNLLVVNLSKLCGLYKSDSSVQAQYPPLTHGGKATRTKSMLRELDAKIEKRHFLLCMIVNPLAGNCSAEEYRRRRSFRIWLIIKALEHAVQNQCFSDTQIQKLASFLTQDTHHQNWTIIDKTLTRAYYLITHQPFTLERFTLALGNAAEELKVQSSDKGTSLFLNALLRVAQGHCEEHDIEIQMPMAFKGFPNTLIGSRLPETNNFLGVAYQHFDLPPEQGADIDDDSESALLYSVDPEETPERQRLTGNSILLQTAESSHYLPWSWDKAFPPEIAALEAWLDDQLISTNQHDRLAATMVWLATRLSRSLPFVLELSISDITDSEWRLTPDFAAAHRKSPKRHHSWVPGKDAESYIELYQPDCYLQLPTQLQAIFQSMSAGLEAPTHSSSLHDLWYRFFDEAPETWFNTQAKRQFPRLTSAKLANIEPQMLFNRTGDHSLARLISAHPRAALPAACGYSNWDIKAVENGFRLPIKTTSKPPETRVNLLGSLLAPIDSILESHINRANNVLAHAGAQNLETYHNTVVRYTVMALYAATGCRHLADPFESIAHFCADPLSVFINDKTDDALHSGRLVPLPATAWQILSAYRSHIELLAQAVKPIRPELTSAITRLTETQSDKLPLFFLLDETGQWHSVTDSNIPGEDLFDWPLPSNLFRHRYAQQLARRGVDPEVIDGWMGHAERGVATYDDRSARCWLTDYGNYQQILGDVFNRLGFRIPVQPSLLPPMEWHVDNKNASYREPKYFGQKKRRQNRQAALENAQRIANEDLDLFLGARSLDQLDDGQIQKMSNLMLLREDGLPNPQATIRYAVMVDRLESMGDFQKTRIRRRMTILENERSLVTDRCPSALGVMTKLKKWMRKTKTDTDKATVSKSEALYLAAAFLAIEKRLTYPNLLEDVVRGRNYRLIQNKKRQQYLEYNENLIDHDFSQPVQRHEIDYKTASLLGYGYRIKSSVDWDKGPTSPRMHDLASILRESDPSVRSKTASGSLQWILYELITIINQANLIQLPGVVSAALSGRNITTSPSITDYFRLSEGVRYQLPGNPTSDFPTPIKSTPAMAAIKIESEDRSVLYDNAKTFLNDLRQLVNDYSKHRARELADRIDRYASKRKTEVSSAVLFLGYWLGARIRQGKGRSNSRYTPYAAATPDRYLSALKEAFLGLTYDVDLQALDEEDITQLCADMIDLQRSNNNELDYFGARLQEFFQWAGEHGIAEPTWEDLYLGNKRRSVRPGLFSENEYQSCLQCILNSPTSTPDQAQMIGFVMFLAFRFGLRAQEAIGLQRPDWCKSGESIWVLVRNNEYRELKRPSSRRAVPLMFKLSDQELSLVTFILSRHDSLAAKSPKAPILCEIVEGRLDVTPLGRHHIANAISQTLKHVTGNSHLSLHHARHSFYNTLAPLLLGFDTQLTKTLTGDLKPSFIREIMLGRDHLTTRRSPMAMARAMGHSTPATGFKSYNRLMTEWADSLTPVRNARVRQIPNAVQIQQWSVQKQPSQASNNPLFSAQLPTPANIAQALRLKALGYHYDRIEASLRLKPGSLAPVDWLVNRVNRKLRFIVFDVDKQKSVQDYGERHPNLLLKKIGSQAWIRLIDQAKSFSAAPDLENASALPTIEHIPALVGRNGHLLMHKHSHYRLIKRLIALFGLPEKSYGVFAKHNDPQATQRLFEHGFRVSKVGDSDQSKKPQLDTYSILEEDSHQLQRKYAGIIFQKGFAGCIRNSHELVVAMIIVAASFCNPKAHIATQENES